MDRKELESKILELVAISYKKNIEELSLETSFKNDLGGASVQMVALVAEIEKSIEELKNRPEEQKPVVEEAFCYSDANNSEYFTCLMKNKAVAEGTAEETFNFAFGDVDGLLESNFHYVRGEQVIDARITSTDIDFINMEVSIATEQADALITAARETDGSLGMTADIKAKTQNVNAKIELNTKALGGDRYGFKVEMFMGGETPLLTAEGSYGKGGELTSVFSGEDITVVSRGSDERYDRRSDQQAADVDDRLPDEGRRDPCQGPAGRHLQMAEHPVHADDDPPEDNDHPVKTNTAE